MNRPELVRGRDEEDAGKVHRSLEVVIAERMVLRRIQHLEQRGGWIAMEADRHLVDLVEHEDRIHRPCLLERLDDAAWHRPDVGAAMPPNLRFVSDAAQ